MTTILEFRLQVHLESDYKKQFFCCFFFNFKITASKVEMFVCIEHPLMTNSFFCIFLLFADGTQYIHINVMASTFV